jgi:CRISPR-associated protein Cmr4
MFDAKTMLFIYVETPLHAGTGRGLGAVDLPIQRERTSHYPIVQASSLKGRLRAATDPSLNPNSSLSKPEHLAVFGPETGETASDHAGALSAGDARVLLFPVRSLAGVFAWTTSRDALARFLREAEMVGLKPGWRLPPEPDGKTSQCWVNGDKLIAGGSVVLEEFSFTPDQTHAETVAEVGTWLAKNALPRAGYDYWEKALPEKLCVLPVDAFRDFALYATEVQTHVRLNPQKKTVETGALWTVENLPVDTLMYAPFMATASRRPDVSLTGKDLLAKVRSTTPERTQLGGDETTGQGMVALRFVAEFAGGGK